MSASAPSGPVESVSGRPWEVATPAADEVDRLQDRLGLNPVTAAVLVSRGVTTPEAAERFLDPGLEGLHSPFAFAQMEAAVERVLAAIEGGERIVVHGDYDVDGITATVLLVTVLRHLGGDVEFILPHRIRDGYGLGPAGVDRAADAGAGLLIAVDCGITALEAADRAAEKGIDLIVADHHLPRPELPRAVALLNPRLPDSGYPEDDLAAVAIAFKLARAVLERHPRDLSGISMLKLVALGTVADLVPLQGENRLMTIHGLAGLRQVSNPGLAALLDVAGVGGRAVSSGDVGFRIAPRINAAGRIGDPTDAAELFLTADPGRARRLAGSLQRLNTERRRLERQVLEEAVEQTGEPEDPVVVAAGEGWHRGVIGIVASRLVDLHGRPALVAAIEGDQAHGSARSVPGFDIVGALHGVAGLLDDYGGHQQAAGFRLPAARLEELRRGLVEGAADLDMSGRSRPLRCDAEVDGSELTRELALEMERLAPFGIGNARPRLLCRGLVLSGAPEILKDAHLKLRLRGRSGDIEALAWRRADLAGPLEGAEEISLVAALKVSRWGGRLTPQLEIRDLAVHRRG